MEFYKYVTNGWKNLLSKIGTKGDKRTYNQFTADGLLADQELANIYATDGIGRKIITTPADDMTREWITLEEDKENILTKLDEIDCQGKFNQAIRWARLFGGSAILIGAMDGGDFDKPLNKNRVKDIEYLKVIERGDIDLQSSEFNADEKSRNFGKIELFNIRLPQTLNVKEYRKVHRSRLILFHGEDIPNSHINISMERKYWGLSVLQIVYDKLSDLGMSMSAVSNLMQESTVGKYKFSDLAAQLANNGEDAIYNRMQIMDTTKSIINAVMLDKDEDYQRDTINFSGIPEVIDRQMMLVSGIAHIPVTKLFGRSPAGQNSTGEADLTNYYDGVRSDQNNKVKGNIKFLVELLSKKKNKLPEVIFNPLKQLSEKEKMEMENNKANAISTKSKAYLSLIEAGALNGEDIEKMVYNDPLFNTEVLQEEE